MTQEAHKRWMKVTAFLIASFGPICMFGVYDPLSGPLRLSIDLLSWPVDGLPAFPTPDGKLASAILGGFLFGWGVMIWFLSGKVYDAEPELVRRALLFGILSWFIVDSTGSILGGHASNAVFNVAILFSLVGPLWLPAKS